MLGVGVILVLLQVSLGHYYVQGVGYATIQDVLSEGLSPFSLLLLLFALKVLVTSVTLGSGGSGGIFFSATFSRSHARRSVRPVLAFRLFRVADQLAGFRRGRDGQHGCGCNRGGDHGDRHDF